MQPMHHRLVFLAFSLTAAKISKQGVEFPVQIRRWELLGRKKINFYFKNLCN